MIKTFTMPVKLPCVAGDAGCTWESIELEFEQAKILLDGHLQYAHQAASGGAAADTSRRPEKFPRPEIKMDASTECWTEFETVWKRYKEEYSLTGNRLINQLYACCSEEMRTAVSRLTGGTQFSKSEKDLLDVMRSLAVRYQNPAVHVQEFLQVTQLQDESVRHCLTRLRGIASRCNFSVKCPEDGCQQRDISYADQMIRFKLISGLYDSEIKEDVLSCEEKSLEETVKFIEAKESGKIARKSIGASAVQPAGKVAAAATPETDSKCSYCGRIGHGAADREQKCPAWNKTCGACQKRGHFRQVCKSGTPRPKQRPARGAAAEAEAEAVSGATYSLNTISAEADTVKQVGDTFVVRGRGEKMSKVRVPHMLYDQLKWSAAKCPDQPLITLGVRVDTRAYRQQNIKPPSAYRHREAEMTVLADSGCQATCMGTAQLSKLGLSVSDLLEVDFRMTAANQSNIKIHGALFTVISGHDKAGKLWETHQLVYVADGVDKILLSREALSKLGMINENFPSVGCAASAAEATPEPITNSELYDLTPCSPAEDGTCSCPRREPAPAEYPQFDPSLSVAELRKRILDHYASSAFNKCTRQKLPLMKGEPMPIPVREDVKPTAIHTPVPVPRHWEEKVYRDLMRDVALGVIEPVPVNSPVTWCSRMITVPKHSGEPRRTVDLQALNRASVRQTYPTKSPFMLASEVPAGKIKSVLDIWNSFHSVEIRKEDRDKTCFLTPWGRFRYCVAPQGYLSSMDGYCHRFALTTEEFDNKVVIVDDSLVHSDDVEKNFYDVCKYIKTCHDNGLIFNPDKFQFGMETVDFAGLEVTMDGVKPSSKFLEAIRSFPRPDSLSAARSFFGMVNQVTYAFAMSAVMEEFRHLLKPETWSSGFTWTESLESKFNLAKEKIVEAVVNGVKYFENDRWTCLATDWSKQGIGFFLMQKWCVCEGEISPNCCNEGWKLVLAGGRFTKPAESRYSPVEGELLAVVDALQKAKHFLLGCSKLVVAVDHKPLLGILNDKSLADIDNPRLLMLKEKTLWYNFSVVHVSGKKNCGPDYLSRIQEPGMSKKEARVNLILGFAGAQTTQDDISLDDQDLVDGVVKSLSSENGIRAVTFDDVKSEVSKDQEMLELVTAISNEMDSDSFPDNLSAYNKYRENLSVLDNVPMYGRRVIIPRSLRKKVLESLHSAHQCTVKMMDRARDSVFWPGMTNDVENTRKMCSYCERNSPSQAAMPPLPLQSPEYPHQMVTADYCNIKGKSWLVIADRFSGWLSVYYYPRDASSNDLIKTLKDYFSIFGVCEHFSSDEGPQFRSAQFQEFLKTWGVVQHRVSSAYHPHSNLRAETSIKSAKRILMENTKSDGSPDHDKLVRAIMQHRNTPDSEFKLSPSQLIFGRPIRDFLPIKPNQFSPSEVWIDNREKRELAFKHRLLRGAERWSQNTRDLKPLQVGEKVMVQNQHGAGKIAKKWDKSGLVVEDLGFNKYRIKVDGSGRLTDRNRQFLRKFSPVTPSSPGPCPSKCFPSSEERIPSEENQMPAQDLMPAQTSQYPDKENEPEPAEIVPEPTSNPEEDFITPPSSPETSPEPQINRRSGRIRQPFKPFNIHDTSQKSYRQEHSDKT